MSGQTFVELDGEVTGSELEDGHALIQVGLTIAVFGIGQPTAPIDPERRGGGVAPLPHTPCGDVAGVAREDTGNGPAICYIETTP